MRHPLACQPPANNGLPAIEHGVGSILRQLSNATAGIRATAIRGRSGGGVSAGSSGLVALHLAARAQDVLAVGIHGLVGIADPIPIEADCALLDQAPCGALR